jgi:hypothetical protein
VSETAEVQKEQLLCAEAVMCDFKKGILSTELPKIYLDRCYIFGFRSFEDLQRCLGISSHATVIMMFHYIVYE